MHLESDLLLSSSAQIFLQEANNVWEDWAFDDQSIWARGMAQGLGLGLEGFRFEGDGLFDSPVAIDVSAGSRDSQREEDLTISLELQRSQENQRSWWSPEQGAMTTNVDSETSEGRPVPMNTIRPENFSSPCPQDMQKMNSVSPSSLAMEISSPCTVVESACSNSNILGSFGSLDSPSAPSPPSSATLQITLVNGLLSCEYDGLRDSGNSGMGSVQRLADASTDAPSTVEELFMDEKRANSIPHGLSPAYLQGLSQLGDGLSIPAMDQPGPIPQISEGALYPLFPPMYSSMQGHPIPSSAMRLPNLSDLRGVNLEPVISPLCTRDMKLGYGPLSSFESDQCSPLDETGHKIRKYSVEERKQRIHRYRSKRTKRNFDKKIKYACRKTLADGRSRVRGRFARNEDAGEMDLKANAHPDEDEDEVVGIWTPSRT